MVNVLLQHDGAHAHSVLTMYVILKEHFSGPQDWLSMLNQHLPCYYHGHQIVLTLLYVTTLCGALSRGKWQCTAVLFICNNKELCTAVEQAFTIITSRYFWCLTNRVYQDLRVRL